MGASTPRGPATKNPFPKTFLWGASTAAHQVEGNTHNQWSEWERARAATLAAEFPKKLKWLPRYEALKSEGTNPENYISGNAIEHYQRYAEDFKLIKELRMNAYRFSIEWSRIEPEEGTWDEAAIEHYRKYFTELKRLGIEPIPTLWHWTMPVWFTDKGGFEKRQNIQYFVRFAQKMAEEYGAACTYLLTLNEPNVYTTACYLSAEWPPQKRNLLLFFRVYWNLVLTHRQAYAAVKKARPRLHVGISMHMLGAKPDRESDWLGGLTARVVAYTFNRWYLNRIRKEQDFIGINYYFANYYHYLRPFAVTGPKSDLGWYMEPSNIEQVITDTWKHYHIPILITENGLADNRDTHRQWWLQETIGAMEKALANGVDLRGYLHWSLLDNFEWAFGWWPKFGLIEVDRTTMRRTIRPSARWLAERIKDIQG